MNKPLISKVAKQLIKRAYAFTLGKPIGKYKEKERQLFLSSKLRHVSKQELVEDIRNFGFFSGSTVFVHSSLKNIGYIEGGAVTILEVLIDVIVHQCKGTLALPAFSINGTMHNTLQEGKCFDVIKTPTNMGALPLKFSKMDGVIRSVHPTHSVAAMGNEASWLTEGHISCGTNFGPGSPFHRLIETDGYICGLGTHLGTVTFYHVLEDTIPDYPVNIYSKDSPFEIVCKDINGVEHRNKYYSHKKDGSRTRIDSSNNIWIREIYTKYFEAYGNLRWHKIGETKAWVIKASDMYRCMKELCDMRLTIYTTESEGIPAPTGLKGTMG